MQKNFRAKFTAFIHFIFVAALLFSACQSPNRDTGGNHSGNTTDSSAAQPTIEVEGAETRADDYRIVTGDTLKVHVRETAGANQAEILYRPIIAGDRAIKLQTLKAGQNGGFSVELPLPQDFNGELWAHVHYPDGTARMTNRLRVAAGSDTAQTATPEEAPQEPADTDESARSDKLTGGRIEQAALKPGDGNVRITVNVPAFQLTLWQNDREIAMYPVGVGQKAFPIPIGMRHAHEIILNPDWVPPDSEWVRESKDVEPYQRIPADDPDNPLGKIKYPLGNAYLLHEAQAPTDLGNLVSHGCVRIMRDDIFNLTEKIAAARAIPEAPAQIAQARNDSVRRILKLTDELPVDINYDTMVVEGAVLHLYPDVYDRGTNTIDALRTELQSYGVDAARLDDQTLREMLKRVTAEQQFVVSLADIKAGNALTAGRTEPLVKRPAADKQKEEKPADRRSTGGNRSTNRRQENRP